MQSFTEAEKALQAAQARREAALRVHGELEELSKLLE
jgi:uncharacterized protein (UPF0548 family)